MKKLSLTFNLFNGNWFSRLNGRVIKICDEGLKEFFKIGDNKKIKIHITTTKPTDDGNYYGIRYSEGVFGKVVIDRKYPIALYLDTRMVLFDMFRSNNNKTLYIWVELL